MTFGEKLAKLRKENNYTQEQLADKLDVSRQSVSKWESDVAYPETDKLIKLSKLFHCSIDYLLDNQTTEKATTEEPSNNPQKNVTETDNSIPFSIWLKRVIPEIKSAKTVWGMPLYHIGRNAKGFFAIGLKAQGIFSIGLFSTGILSLGLLSFGVIAIGLLSVGLLALGTFAFGLLSFGSIAFGLYSVGAISIGVVSFGALSIGGFSNGALSIGQYIAIGDKAYAAIAIGKSEAVGNAYQHVGTLSSADLDFIKIWLNEHVPAYLNWAKTLFYFSLN